MLILFRDFITSSWGMTFLLWTGMILMVTGIILYVMSSGFDVKKAGHWSIPLFLLVFVYLAFFFASQGSDISSMSVFLGSMPFGRDFSGASSAVGTALNGGNVLAWAETLPMDMINALADGLRLSASDLAGIIVLIATFGRVIVLTVVAKLFQKVIELVITFLPLKWLWWWVMQAFAAVLTVVVQWLVYSALLPRISSQGEVVVNLIVAAVASIVTIVAVVLEIVMMCRPEGRVMKFFERVTGLTYFLNHLAETMIVSLIVMIAGMFVVAMGVQQRLAAILNQIDAVIALGIGLLAFLAVWCFVFFLFKE